MKKILLTLLIWAIAPAMLLAQNAVPVISNVVATADTINQRIDVSFDLADTELDQMEVWLQASNDSGKTWIVPVDSMVGDTGFPISSGTGKMISWHYDPALLSTFGAGLTSFRLRVVADDQQIIDLQEIADQVDSMEVLSQLTELELVRHRTTNLSGLESTKDSLEARMNKAGLNPVRQGALFSGYMGENIVGFKSGTREARKSWLISGHFDTVSNSPGVDDNASGVVTVSEAVRILSGYHSKQSMRFLYFDLEEAGLVGSQHYVQSGVAPWENMQGLLNMDMISYYSDAPNSQNFPAGFATVFPAVASQIQADSSKGNFLLSIVNTASTHLDTTFKNIAATHQPGLKVITIETTGTGTTVPDLRRSDHATFWDEGIPAIWFSDGGNFRNPNYHTPNDTLGSIDISFLLKNIRSIVTTLAELAGLEHSGSGESNDVEIGLALSAQNLIVIQQVSMTVYPNPGSDVFQFQLDLPRAGYGKLEIFDHHGRIIERIEEGWMKSGESELSWHPDLPSGNYLSIFEINGKKIFAPLVILK